MHLDPQISPRAQEMARAIVTLRQDRDGVTPEDLIALGFRRSEIDLHRDEAVAEAAHLYEDVAYSPAAAINRFIVRVIGGDEPAYLACLHPRRFTTEIAEAQAWRTRATAENAAAALPASLGAEVVWP